MTDISRRNVLGRSAVALAGLAAVGAPVSARAAARAATPATQGSLPAVTVTPDADRYGDLVIGNNTRWVGRPDYVRIVYSADQVVQAVQEAVSSGKRLSVHGGGHCYCDFVFNSDVRVVIDMSEMNDSYFDPEHRAFVVEAGAILLKAYEDLYRGWGVTIPGGMCYSVGAGGHICGGGYGLLSRRHGLTVDHLYAVEVVTVDSSGTARIVLATREPGDPNRDLWWAHTGGGGGNFGVVTRYFFRSPGAVGGDPADLLIRPPREVLVSAIALPWSDLTQDAYTTMVTNYGRWHLANSAASSPYAGLCSFLMMNHKANGTAGLLTVMDATVSGAAGLLDSYLRDVIGGVDAQTRPVTAKVGEIGPMPDFYTPQRLPWLQAMKLVGTNNPILTSPTMRGAHKSAYMRANYTAAQIATMYAQLTRQDFQNPDAMAVLLSFGGQINAVAPSQTAASQRGSAFKGLFQSFWSDPAQDDANIAWARAIYGGVYADTGGYPVPNERTEGCYINYPDMDISDPQVNRSGVPWSTLYYTTNYPRLQRIKAAYDPRNIFRHRQSIELPAT